MSGDFQTPVQAITAKGARISVADLVTLAGYGLGLYWSMGGPAWAALASMGCDELDGSIARWLGTADASGAALDWGADVALTPLALMRLARDLQQPAVASVGAPLVLALQAKLRGHGIRPPIGSARALVMAAALLVEHQRARGASTRPNPARARRHPRSCP